jgi:hypothetical protein
MPSGLDDRTVSYLIVAQPLFEDLRQVASQLAGLLVLKATGSRDASPEHPMLHAARHLFDAARDGIEQAQPTEPARQHHGSLRRSCEFLATALAAMPQVMASAADADFQLSLNPLRAAYDELQFASRALPGFRMVAFEQGCCGGHSSGTSQL